VLTAGIDLAAQPAKTGAVLVDWSSEPPTVVRAWRKVTDEQIFALCEEVTRQRGRVGIDCPLGWPRPFVDFVGAHAANRPLPTTELDTQSLRLRASPLSRLGPWLWVPPIRPHPARRTLRRKKGGSTCRRPTTSSPNSLAAHQCSTDAELFCFNWLVHVLYSTPTPSSRPRSATCQFRTVVTRRREETTSGTRRPGRQDAAGRGAGHASPRNRDILQPRPHRAAASGSRTSLPTPPLPTST